MAYAGGFNRGIEPRWFVRFINIASVVGDGTWPWVFIDFQRRPGMITTHVNGTGYRECVRPRCTRCKPIFWPCNCGLISAECSSIVWASVTAAEYLWGLIDVRYVCRIRAWKVLRLFAIRFRIIFWLGVIIILDDDLLAVSLSKGSYLSNFMLSRSLESCQMWVWVRGKHRTCFVQFLCSVSRNCYYRW